MPVRDAVNLIVTNAMNLTGMQGTCVKVVLKGPLPGTPKIAHLFSSQLIWQLLFSRAVLVPLTHCKACLTVSPCALRRLSSCWTGV